jgi:predicted ATPase
MGIFPRARENLAVATALNERRGRPGVRSGLIDPVLNIDYTVHSLSYEALTLWALGYSEQALNKSNEALAQAGSLAHPHTLAYAQFFHGRVRQFRRDARAAQATAESLIALAAEHGFTFWLAQALLDLGGALAEQGRNEEGLVKMMEGFAMLRAGGPRPQYLCLRARACIETGRFAEGRSALNEALVAADEGAGRETAAEIHRLKGELLLRQSASNAAEAQICFERAIEIARKQSAKSWELRATISLSRLLGKQGRRNEARAMLGEIYNWFTEGFDTADLIDAKALLDRLQA